MTCISTKLQCKKTVCIDFTLSHRSTVMVYSWDSLCRTLLQDPTYRSILSVCKLLSLCLSPLTLLSCICFTSFFFLQDLLSKTKYLWNTLDEDFNGCIFSLFRATVSKEWLVVFVFLLCCYFAVIGIMWLTCSSFRYTTKINCFITSSCHNHFSLIYQVITLNIM